MGRMGEGGREQDAAPPDDQHQVRREIVEQIFHYIFTHCPRLTPGWDRGSQQKRSDSVARMWWPASP